MRALIHVNHLLGTGHAFRACGLGKALAKEGVSVTIATGNILPDTIDLHGLTIHQLPIAKAIDHNFSALADENGNEIDDRWRERRASSFYKLWSEFDPDILITEHFPFGRQKLFFELEPVLEAIKQIKPRTLVVSSIRDILVTKFDPKKEQLMAQIFQKYYDSVLVHADKNIVQLESSFRFVDEIADKIHYVGYLYTGKIPNSAIKHRKKEIIVATGGGAFGFKLLETAIDAKQFSKRATDYHWRIFCGPNLPPTSVTDLKCNLPSGVTIEFNRKEYVDILANSSGSISQAGYNTVLDILQSRVPAVLVPSEVNQNEQRRRAEILSERKLAVVVDEENLSANSLALALDQAKTLNSKIHGINIDNGENCAKIILALAKNNSEKN